MSKVKGNSSNKNSKGKKVRKDKLELNKRQKQFVENYLFNGNNGRLAYAVAYENDNENACAVRASEMLKMDKIRNEIERRQAEIKEHNLTHIATAEEILQFYTSVMINPDNKLDHRMKAGEYLGKSMGLFIERVEQTSSTDFTVNLIGLDGERKELNSGEIIDVEAKMIEHEEE